MTIETVAVARSEESVIAEARDALAASAWTVGRCAAEWKSQFAGVRTDADFGVLVGLTADAVYQRRRVWERFGDWSELSRFVDAVDWSYFYPLVGVDDASGWLALVTDGTYSNVAELRAALRANRVVGELAERIESEPIVAVSVPAVEREPVASAEQPAASLSTLNSQLSTADDGVVHITSRDPRESLPQRARERGEDYAPFGAGAKQPGQPPRDRTRLAPERNESAEAAVSRARAALTRIQSGVAKLIAEAPIGHPRWNYVLADHLDALAECVRQGETGAGIKGLDAATVAGILKG